MKLWVGKMRGLLLKLTLFWTVFGVLQPQAGAVVLDGVQQNGAMMQHYKSRLSLLIAVEIEQCLSSAVDAGCGSFACLENNSCETGGLHAICTELVRNADQYDVKGRLFIKDMLKCIAQGLRTRFNCNHRKCSSIWEMVVQLQRHCYKLNDVCVAARANTGAMVEILHQPTAILNKGPHFELLKALIKCDDETVAVLLDSLRSHDILPHLPTPQRHVRVASDSTLSESVPPRLVQPYRHTRDHRQMGGRLSPSIRKRGAWKSTHGKS
uniref:Stanniocalcin n=1 Tax=Eptatretus burgeri TaxID=7764 RepID=A0A3G9D4E0_EPTBU|nr:stanniocalcin [Eptatretus burgeri]